MDMERVLQGPCEDCGEPGSLRVDPFAQDVNNETVLIYLCDEDEQIRAEDI